jgi:hypothetical protein
MATATCRRRAGSRSDPANVPRYRACLASDLEEYVTTEGMDAYGHLDDALRAASDVVHVLWSNLCITHVEYAMLREGLEYLWPAPVLTHDGYGPEWLPPIEEVRSFLDLLDRFVPRLARVVYQDPIWRDDPPDWRLVRTTNEHLEGGTARWRRRAETDGEDQ